MITPQRSGTIFQGWRVVGALFVAGFMLYGGGLYSFILFVPPLAREFHWSSAGTGSLVSAFWLSAPLCLWAAPLVGRFGERRLVIAGIIIEALSLMILFSASSLLQMYLLRALAGLGKILFAITLPIILSKWFSRHFGLAAAIMYSGWSLGGLALAPLTQYLLTNLGWRVASVVLGVAQIAIALPATLWGLKWRSAADAGLNLDGDLPPDREDRHQAAETALPSSRPSYTELLRQLVRQPSFGLIMISTPIYYLTYGGVLLQQAAVVEGSGGTAYVASLVVGITAGCAAFGAVSGGYLYDRLSLTMSTLVAFSFLGAGVICLLVAILTQSTALLIAHATTFGVGIGCGDIFWITLLKRAIPHELFPSAWGIWYFLQLAFLIIAPVCSGAIYDHMKSYSFMLMIETAILVVPISLILLLASSSAIVKGRAVDVA